MNFNGTKNLVKGANKIGAKFIFISSAVVFDKLDMYGQSKVFGEKWSSQVQAGFLIIRPHLIIGYSPNTVNDRTFNRFLKNLREKVPVVYDTSWKFQPTYIGHLSEVIKKYIEGKITANLVSVAFDVFKSKYELASDVLKPFGIKVIGVDQQTRRMQTGMNLTEFKKLNLPIRTYGEMIKKIVSEVEQMKHHG